MELQNHVKQFAGFEAYPFSHYITLRSCPQCCRVRTDRFTAKTLNPDLRWKAKRTALSMIIAAERYGSNGVESGLQSSTSENV